MVEVDFYDLLGVTRSASNDEIENALKQHTRQWTKRASSASLDVRQEAETRLRLLQNAREALLTNAEARSAYDRALAQGVNQTQPVRTGARTQHGTQDWVQTAQAALAQNDYHSAAYAAREATQQLGNSAFSWLLRSRANLGLGRTQDALYEAREAVQMEQNNAEFHFHLGNVYEEAEDWTAALGEYQVASRLSPDTWLYQVSQASVLLQNNAVDAAVGLLRALMGQHSHEPVVRFYLAASLLEMAEQIPRVQSESSYAVTSTDEIGRMRQLANEAISLTDDADTQMAGRNILSYLTRMEEITWRPPDFFLNVGGLVKWIAAAVVIMVIGFIAVGSTPAGALFILAGIGLIALIVITSRVPRWKANARIHGVS